MCQIKVFDVWPNAWEAITPGSPFLSVQDVSSHVSDGTFSGRRSCDYSELQLAHDMPPVWTFHGSTFVSNRMCVFGHAARITVDTVLLGVTGD